MSVPVRAYAVCPRAVWLEHEEPPVVRWGVPSVATRQMGPAVRLVPYRPWLHEQASSRHRDLVIHADDRAGLRLRAWSDRPIRRRQAVRPAPWRLVLDAAVALAAGLLVGWFVVGGGW